LADILSQYPVITARLLSLANSVWAAPVKPVTAIENACARLGLSVVKSISIAIAVSSTFNSSSCPNFDIAGFWTNSILVSEGAFLLASQLPTNKQTEMAKTAQTAGILHGLGLLWLAENLPTETSQALQMVTEDAAFTVNAALIDCTGTDYCEVGAWIGKQWKLPDVLVVAMQQHLDENYRDQHWEIAMLVGSAVKMLADLQSQGDDSPPVNHVLDQLGVDSAQQASIIKKLANKYEKTQILARELFV
jgi:HD-like signal output (HDOD) protein